MWEILIESKKIDKFYRISHAFSRILAIWSLVLDQNWQNSVPSPLSTLKNRAKWQLLSLWTFCVLFYATFLITNHVYSKIHDYDYDYRSFFCIHFLSEFYLQMRTKKWCHRLGWTTIIEQRNRMCYRALPPFKPIRRHRSAQPRFSVRRLSLKNWTLLPMKCLKVSGSWEALFRGPSFV